MQVFLDYYFAAEGEASFQVSAGGVEDYKDWKEWGQWKLSWNTSTLINLWIEKEAFWVIVPCNSYSQLKHQQCVYFFLFLLSMHFCNLQFMFVECSHLLVYFASCSSDYFHSTLEQQSMLLFGNSVKGLFRCMCTGKKHRQWSGIKNWSALAELLTCELIYMLSILNAVL